MSYFMHPTGREGMEGGMDGGMEGGIEGGWRDGLRERWREFCNMQIQKYSHGPDDAQQLM